MAIIINDICKEYKIKDADNKQVVLDNVKLEIADGDMVAIKGKSGAGKSTLLHIIGLLDVWDSGSYELDGQNIVSANSKLKAKYRNEKIGYVLQDFGLIEDETVLENVCLPLMLGKKPIKEIREIAKNKLEKVGVSHLSSKKVSVLSGGEKQRVAIARALVNEPNYILADEPTGALDSGNAEKIMELLLELNKEGKTVVIVTHDDEVARKCKRIIYIKDGKIEELDN
ncbi:MAG: ABC transporter ATP-binding protein [Lachnospiraceae bacterium]|nr:ABC transporter ATP-binding protein [Lachnospiraceae bacterium]